MVDSKLLVHVVYLRLGGKVIVNSEMLDIMATDTYSEGQETEPPPFKLCVYK